MGFGYRLYPSYKEYNGVGGKGIDKMIDPLIAKHDDLSAFPTERRLLSLCCGMGERRSRLLGGKAKGGEAKG